MKLLITMKLSDRSLKHHIDPIVSLEEVDEVLLVRDTKGPEISKVKYYCPPNWVVNFTILALLFKFLLMIYLSIKEKPLLVHGYLLFPHGILAFLTGKLTHKKVGVSLIAGPVEMYVLGGSPVNKYSYCQELLNLSPLAKILLSLLKKCDAITVTGSYTKQFLLYHNVSKNKIFILPHVLDDRFKPRNLKKEYDLIYVGRLAPVKHVDVLIRAIEVVKNSYPHIKLVIVGDGECRFELEKLTKSLNLTNNICFSGYQQDVWNWYNKGKLSILTSEREGFPYTVIESLRCGLPVITSKCGDISDVIKIGYNGIIIDDFQDYSSFAESILLLLKNPRLIDKYSTHALKSINEIGQTDVSIIWSNLIKELVS
jgi:glycosyltransferase involved in cell wall biosynthesis